MQLFPPEYVYSFENKFIQKAGQSGTYKQEVLCERHNIHATYECNTLFLITPNEKSQLYMEALHHLTWYSASTTSHAIARDCLKCSSAPPTTSGNTMVGPP